VPDFYDFENDLANALYGWTPGWTVEEIDSTPSGIELQMLGTDTDYLRAYARPNEDASSKGQLRRTIDCTNIGRDGLGGIKEIRFRFNWPGNILAGMGIQMTASAGGYFIFLNRLPPPDDAGTFILQGTAQGIYNAGPNYDYNGGIHEARVQFNERPTIYTGTITGIATGNPCVITALGHDLKSTTMVEIETGTTSDINGVYSITKIDDDSFSIPINCTDPGDGTGTWFCPVLLTTKIIDPTGIPITYHSNYRIPFLDASDVELEMGFISPYETTKGFGNAEAQLLSVTIYYDGDDIPPDVDVDGTVVGSANKFVTLRSGELTPLLQQAVTDLSVVEYPTLPESHPFIVQAWHFPSHWDLTGGLDDTAERFNTLMNLSGPLGYEDEFRRLGLQFVWRTSSRNGDVYSALGEAGSPERTSYSESGNRANIVSGDAVEYQARQLILDIESYVLAYGDFMPKVMSDSEYSISFGYTYFYIIDATGGSFTLSWGGYTTVPIVHSASETQIKNALVAVIPEFTNDNLIVSGGVAGCIINPLDDFTLNTGNTAGDPNSLSADFSGLEGALVITRVYNNATTRYLAQLDGLTRFCLNTTSAGPPYNALTDAVIDDVGTDADPLWEAMKWHIEQKSWNVTLRTARTTGRQIWPGLELITDPLGGWNLHEGLDHIQHWIRTIGAPRNARAPARIVELSKLIRRRFNNPYQGIVVGAQIGNSSNSDACPADIFSISQWNVVAFGGTGVTHWGLDLVISENWPATGAITDISEESPSVITAPSHGLNSADQVHIQTGTSTVPEITGPYRITKIDNDSFSIKVDVTDGGDGTGTWEVDKFHMLGAETWQRQKRLKQQVYDKHADLFLRWSDRPRDTAIFESISDDQFGSGRRWTGTNAKDNAHRAMLGTGEPCDIIDEYEIWGGKLNQYTVLIIPSYYIGLRSILDELKSFAEAGGTIIAHNGSCLELAGESDTWNWPDGNSLLKLDRSYSRYGVTIAPSYVSWKVEAGTSLDVDEYVDFLAALGSHIKELLPYPTLVQMNRDDVVANVLIDEGTDTTEGRTAYLVLINDRRQAGPYHTYHWPDSTKVHWREEGLDNFVQLEIEACF